MLLQPRVSMAAASSLTLVTFIFALMLHDGHFYLFFFYESFACAAVLVEGCVHTPPAGDWDC